ncbi:hypothetical protein ACVWZW_001821 [Bradyrhizobium sp. F1.13.4]
MTDRNDAMAAGALEHHAVFDRHQRNRQVFVGLRARTNGLGAGRHARQRDACGVAMRRRCVPVEEGMARRRLQADRGQHVPPGFGAVVLRVGLAREGTEAHRIDPDCSGSKQPLCQTHAVIRRSDGPQMTVFGHALILETSCSSEC